MKYSNSPGLKDIASLTCFWTQKFWADAMTQTETTQFLSLLCTISPMGRNNWVASVCNIASAKTKTCKTWMSF